MSDNRDAEGHFAEPAFGQAGLERSAGYAPMEDQRKKEPGEELTTREAAEERAKSEAEAESIERGYFNEDSGKQTVTLDRAAQDLAELRKAEDDARQAEIDEQIRKEFDADKDPKPTKEAKPDAEASEEKPAEIAEEDFDAELERALENPRLKEAIAKQISDNEEAKQRYTSSAETALAVAQQAFITQFPEFANTSTLEQRAQVLLNIAQHNPARLAQLEAFANQTNGLIQARQQQENAAAEQQKQAFRSYAAEQDQLFEKSNPFRDMPASERHRIADEIVRGFEEYGIDGRQYEQMYQNDRTLRHAGFQRMMIDAARYRMVMSAAGKAKTASVPPVARPGVRSSGDHSGRRSATDAFRAEPNIKNAAAALAARRASRN